MDGHKTPAGIPGWMYLGWYTAFAVYVSILIVCSRLRRHHGDLHIVALDLLLQRDREAGAVLGRGETRMKRVLRTAIPMGANVGS